MTVLSTPPSNSASRAPSRESISSSDATLKAMEIAIEQKAQDVCGLDIRTVSDIADYFVIASGTSDRHVRGIVDKVVEKLRDLGERPYRITGLESAQWVILDYGDFVVHIFYEPVRQYYSFDELWTKGLRLRLRPEVEEAAKKLRTGMIMF